MSAENFRQEMPPKGGFGGITWERIPLKKQWSGTKIFALWFTVSALAYRTYFENIRYRRRIRRENEDVTVAIEPIIIAERDRNFLKQLRMNREEEKELMKNVPGWKVGTLYGDPIYKTIEDRMIEPPSLEYYAHVDPKERLNMHTYDFWM